MADAAPVRLSRFDICPDICHLSEVWNSGAVTALRERLGVDRPTFARIVGVDTRTVFRWEAGDVTPSGAAEAVLTGLREKLASSPETADEVIKFVVGAATIGGLAYLVVKMLDAAAPPPTRPRRRRRR